MVVVALRLTPAPPTPAGSRACGTTLSEIGLTLAYGLYAFFALVSFFFVLWKVPETKGRELEDMSDEGHHRSTGAGV